MILHTAAPNWPVLFEDTLSIGHEELKVLLLDYLLLDYFIFFWLNKEEQDISSSKLALKTLRGWGCWPHVTVPHAGKGLVMSL